MVDTGADTLNAADMVENERGTDYKKEVYEV